MNYPFYFRQSGLGRQRWEAACDWGPHTDFVEVLEDQYANRHVLVYGDGRMLRYDRNHWIDEFARLIGSKFSRQPKWTKHRREIAVISAADFERVWQRSLASELWKDQQLRSLTHRFRKPVYD